MTQTKLAVAVELIKNEKHKKALVILKKINAKRSNLSCTSLSLEASCLIQSKAYALALLKLKSALPMATTDQEKLPILNNIAHCLEKINNKEESIPVLVDLIKVDPSPSTFPSRLSLVKLAHTLGKFDLVEEFIIPLLHSVQYEEQVLSIHLDALHKSGKSEEAMREIEKLIARSRLEKTYTLPPNICHFILLLLQRENRLQMIQNLRTVTDEIYGHEAWYQEAIIQVTENESAQQILKDKMLTDAIPQKMLRGTNNAAINSVRHLMSELQKDGASFYTDLVIREEEENYTVCVNGAVEDKRKLMSVPITSMPILRDFNFSINAQGRIIASPVKRQISKGNENILDRLLDLYYTSKKTQTWRESYILYKLAGNKMLFDKLAAMRSDGTKYSEHYFSHPDEISNESVLTSFFSSRVFAFSREQLRSVGIKTTKNYEQAFIPILELINHDISAPGFVVETKSGTISTLVSCAAPDEEIFVRYNLDDPLITLLSYGFIDNQAPWLYTLPISVKSPNGLFIDLHNHMSTASVDDIPPNMLNSAEFFPGQTKRVNNRIALSKLVFSREGDYLTLPAILKYILKKHDVENRFTHSSVLDEEVSFLIREILAKNKEIWSSFKNCVLNNTEGEAKTTLLALCQLYLDTIESHLTHHELVH